MEQIREETDHRLKLRLLSAALMIFVAQLDINLIINGFRISLAIIFLPVFAFLSKGFPVFSVTAIAAPGSSVRTQARAIRAARRREASYLFRFSTFPHPFPLGFSAAAKRNGGLVTWTGERSRRAD